MCYIFEIYKGWIVTLLILREASKQLSEDLINSKLQMCHHITKRSNSLTDPCTTITNYLKLIVALKMGSFCVTA